MAAWNRALVDIFTLLSQQPKQEKMIQFASGIQYMIDYGIAPSAILSQVCAMM